MKKRMLAKGVVWFMIGAFVLVAVECEEVLPEVETTLDGKFIITYPEDQQVPADQRRPGPPELKEYERGVVPQAGPEGAYGHPSKRYWKLHSNLSDAVERVKVVTRADDTDDPFNDEGESVDAGAARKRVVVVPDAYAAKPIGATSSASTHAEAVQGSVGGGTQLSSVLAGDRSLGRQLKKKKPEVVYPNRQFAAPTANGENNLFESGEVAETAFPLPNCYRTGGGFLCCNKRLEELIYQSNTVVKEKNLSRCNVQAFVQTLQKRAEEIFQTTFEIIIGTGDFASKTRFKDNLICKTIAENKVVLVYATPEPYSLTEPNTPLSFS